MKNIFFYLLFACLNIFMAQEKNILFEDIRDRQDFEKFTKEELALELDSIHNKTLIQSDSLFLENEFQLSEIITYALPIFNSELERNYYYWLKRKLYKAYPYYLKAIKNYENLEDSLQNYKTNKKVKKYIKNRQKELTNSYEEELKKLTRTEGQILCKLLHRRTNKTTYTIIKELRGGLNAFFWEAKAGVFDISLKETFDPENIREDYFLETILMTGIRKGELEIEE